MPGSLRHHNRLAGVQRNFLRAALIIEHEPSGACDEVDELVSVKMSLALVP
jgi:hypothetical protein